MKWKIKKLADVCTLSQGLAINAKTKKYLVNKSDLPLLRIKDLKAGTYEKFIDPDNFPKKCFVNKDELIYTRTGQVGLVFTGFQGILHNNCFKINPSEELFQDYLSYFIQADCFKKKIIKLASKTAQPDITHKLFKSQEIAFPEIEEQKRIVEILDKVFERIERAEANTKKNLANAIELFDSYLNRIFSVKDNNWEDIKLGEIADFRNGLNFTKGSRGEVVKIVGVKNFQNYFWIREDELESVTTDGEMKEIDVLKKGDILTVRSNGNKELIGRCILANDLSQKTSHSGFTIRIRLNKKNIYPQFIVYFLKSKELRKQLTESGGGISISSLNQKGLSLLKLALPDFKTQKQIVEQIDLVANKAQKLERIYQRKLEAIAELKQSILQKAFTGNLT